MSLSFLKTQEKFWLYDLRTSCAPIIFENILNFLWCIKLGAYHTSLTLKLEFSKPWPALGRGARPPWDSCHFAIISCYLSIWTLVHICSAAVALNMISIQQHHSIFPTTSSLWISFYHKATFLHLKRHYQPMHINQNSMQNRQNNILRFLFSGSGDSGPGPGDPPITPPGSL